MPEPSKKLLTAQEIAEIGRFLRRESHAGRTRNAGLSLVAHIECLSAYLRHVEGENQRLRDTVAKED